MLDWMGVSGCEVLEYEYGDPYGTLEYQLEVLGTF